MKQHLVITAITEIPNSLPLTLTKIAHDTQAQFTDCRISTVGQHSTLHALMSGTWDVIAKLESQLNLFAKKLNAPILFFRTQPRMPAGEHLSYLLQTVSTENSNIPFQICEFLKAQDIIIHEFYTGTFTSQVTGTAMMSVVASIAIPVKFSISELRDQFLLLCENLNIDGAIEPEKT